jgi:ligand-binding sensor domain-containing protein/signal transduction histidine kinase
MLNAAWGADEFSQQYDVQNWNVEDGLLDGEITGIQQTPDGYLWIGTPKGLTRFDGTRFKVFKGSPDSPLADSRITCLLTSRDGTLWISTENGDVVRRRDRKFENTRAPAGAFLDQKSKRAPGSWLWDRRMHIIEGNEGTQDAGLLDSSTHLIEDAEGTIWEYVSGTAVMRLKGNQWTVFTPTTGLPDGGVRQLTTDHEGQVWAEAGGKLHRYAGDTWDSQQQPVPLSEPWPVLAPANQGGAWVAEPRGGSWVLNGGQVRRFANGQWHNGPQPIPAIPFSTRSTVTCLMEDHSGRLWYGAAAGGVFFSGPDGNWQRLKAHNPFSQGYISCLFEDAQGNIWVGTVGDGLYRVTPQPLAMLPLPPPLENAEISTLSVAHDGAMWIGTSGFGVVRYYNHDRFTTFAEAQGLRNLHICTVCEDSQTNVWTGTSEGLFRLEGERFAQFTGPPEISKWVKALFEDRSGRLWIGTLGALVSLQNGQFTVFYLRPDRGYCDVRSITEDAAGDIWIGTMGQGLFRLPHGPSKKISREEAFPAADARSLLSSKDGAIWVGSWGEGLIRGYQGSFSAFTTEDGLPSDRMQSIISDDEGRLWLSTDNGIVGMSPQVIENYKRGSNPPLWCQHLSLTEGLANRGCSGAGQPVSARMADGRLWFPDYEGIAELDPRTVTTKSLPPAVSVEEVLADGKVLLPSPSGELQVSSSVRRFEFNYTAADLAPQHNLRFRYKLEGIDNDWVEAGAQRVAYYSRLKPGQYQFRAMIGGSDGQWHGADQGVYLRVTPLLWERGWMQVLAGGLFIGVLAGGIAWSQRRKFRLQVERLEMQQAVETERRRIARDLHDELGARLTATALQGELVVQDGEIPDNAKSQMSLITRRIRKLIGAVDEVVWTTDPENDSLTSMVAFLCDYVEQFLAPTGISYRLEVSPELPNLPLAAQARRNLLLAVKEALNNGVRYADARIIRLKICVEKGWLHVEVSDDGRGFEAAETRAKGKGLLNIRSRMELVQGKAEIRSETGKGTTVSLSVLLPEINGRK